MAEKICAAEILVDDDANFSAETVAALKETREISAGKIEAKSFKSVAELLKDLTSEADD